MSAHTQKLALLIGDICGSTLLYERLGDAAARERVEAGLAMMRANISPYKGALVNAIGDQILCTFPNSEWALQAACAMQQAVSRCKFADGYQMAIRVGLHYGDVILGDEAAFGDAVNVTARVAAIANANQIMTTEAVFQALPWALKQITVKFMNASLKGKMEQYAIYVVHWEQDETAVTWINVNPARNSQSAQNELTLLYAGQRFKVNEARKKVTMGRGDNCDIVVKSVFASRHHLHCEIRADKIVVVDTSINGTYLRYSDGRVLSLVREEAILLGNGMISLGQDRFGDDGELIEFIVSPKSFMRVPAGSVE